MRDGVKIAIDLYLPKGCPKGERLPTLIRYARYGRSYELQLSTRIFYGNKPFAPKLIRRMPEFFVPHGYAWVEVDVRGAGASYGSRPHPFHSDELKDGAEIVDWIISQPWSNGCVGTIGTSYSGAAAGFTLVNKHPAVKATAPMFSPFDIYTDQLYPGGVHLIWFASTWNRLNKAVDRNAPHAFFGWDVKIYIKGIRPVDGDRNRAMLKAAVRDHARNMDIFSNARLVTFRDAIPQHPGKNIDLISPHAYAEAMRQSGTAVYNYSGWFDGACGHSAINRYLTVGNPGSRLTLGPWAHGGYRNLSPFLNSPRTRFNQLGELLRFFDHHLKGEETGISDEPPVHYYTMGEEKWKAARTWPPPGGEKVSFFLAESNTLTLQSPKGPEGLDTYQVDFTAETGEDSRWKILMGLKEYTLYPDRKRQGRKLLCYSSAALKKDMEVTGHPVVTLFVSSSDTDGTFFVYLEDVDEDGHIHYVTEGQLRALHRKQKAAQPPDPLHLPYRTFLKKDASPLVPGVVAELTFALQPTSYLFKKGHSIRISLAGADREHFSPEPARPPSVKYYRTRIYPSRIELPVIGLSDN